MAQKCRRSERTAVTLVREGGTCGGIAVCEVVMPFAFHSRSDFGEEKQATAGGSGIGDERCGSLVRGERCRSPEDMSVADGCPEGMSVADPREGTSLADPREGTSLPDPRCCGRTCTVVSGKAAATLVS